MQDSNTYYTAAVGDLCKMHGSQIADQLKLFRKGHASDSEYQSWCRSVPAFVSVLHRAGLDNLMLVLEYETPIGGRIDAVLLGCEKASGHPLALIAELKQWSAIRENAGNAESTVSVCISRQEHLYEDRLHPVQQTLTYAKHLKENHSNVSAGRIKILCCQFLHNFQDKRQLFEGNYQKYASCEHETYVKGEEEKLAAFLKDTFFPAYREEAVHLFLEGKYVLGEISFRGLRSALEKKENAVMIDDQIEINLQIWRKMIQSRDDPRKKELIVISGAPGTGKTVLGLHVLYTYYQIFGNEGGKKGKCVFALPRSRTLAQVIEGESGIAPVYLDKIPQGLDVCVIDEAHRMERLDRVMTELFEKAKIVVVLQDDRQRIRLTEEGSRDHFLQFAERHHLDVSGFCLSSQKRSGYCGGYVSSLNRLLYDRAGESVRNRLGVEVAAWDSLFSLDRQLRTLAARGERVKWYAPFCWDWTRTTLNRDISIRTAEGTFEKAWNPMQGQYAWYKGDSGEALDQVGCIYTAQGLEFDYVGVIWWSDLLWDESCSDWKIDLDACRDLQFVKEIIEFYNGKLLTGSRPWRVSVNGREMGIGAFLAESGADRMAIRELVLNIYRVLLTRAKKGVYIWFKNGETREHFEKVMGVSKWQAEKSMEQ